MSEMEYQSGTLQHMGMNVEEFWHHFCKDKEEWPKEFARDWLNEGYENSSSIMILNNEVYSVRDRKHELNCEIIFNDDRTVTYQAYWYNGGGSIEDVIESKLERISESKKPQEINTPELPLGVCINCKHEIRGNVIWCPYCGTGNW